ncbi:sulfite exporter TauE/SafE family protein [Micromonospora sp. NBC_01813]|uniref:sulfite exporter TauE/SafE family protein n=1 Tax=Micromonospora sp. NBC_01813 TaxID=2975988 RepID=UPI002DD8C1CF|nr:sulfite exporter TauE/SafE family protein [Micromonospora sp. NBC_01813]WSA09216.1 sulfite exporter TauE/SafE family protein [Micromonospora sp. NBC_01813]
MTDPWILLAAAGAGALAAALGTPTGVSGGLLLLPLLLTAFGLPPTVASATNLLFNIVSTPAGITRHLRQHSLDRRLALLLAGAAAPAAVAGALANIFWLGDSTVFRHLVAGLLVAVAATLLLPRPRGGRSAQPLAGPAVTAVLAVAGLASGALGGFYGLGGAILAAPAALLITGWPTSRVSGAALITTFTVSVTGLLTYAAADLAGATRVQTPHWPIGLALGFGGLFGAWLAVRHASRLPDRLLRTGLAVLVVLGALRLAG